MTLTYALLDRRNATALLKKACVVFMAGVVLALTTPVMGQKNLDSSINAAEVAAGSMGNEVDLRVAIDAGNPLSQIKVKLAKKPRIAKNVRISEPDIRTASSSKVFTISFDIPKRAKVGATDTLEFEIGTNDMVYYDKSSLKFPYRVVEGEPEIDERIEACNSVVEAGANLPASVKIDMADFQGQAKFSHEMFTVKDRMLVYGGSGGLIHDTGCVSGAETIEFMVAVNSGTYRVDVEPNCDGTSSTAWNFKVECPGLQFGKPVFLLTEIRGPQASQFKKGKPGADGIQRMQNTPGYARRRHPDFTRSDKNRTQKEPDRIVEAVWFDSFPRQISLGKDFRFSAQRRVRFDAQSAIECEPGSSGAKTDSMKMVLSRSESNQGGSITSLQAQSKDNAYHLYCDEAKPTGDLLFGQTPVYGAYTKQHKVTINAVFKAADEEEDAQNQSANPKRPYRYEMQASGGPGNISPEAGTVTIQFDPAGTEPIFVKLNNDITLVYEYEGKQLSAARFSQPAEFGEAALKSKSQVAKSTPAQKPGQASSLDEQVSALGGAQSRGVRVSPENQIFLDDFLGMPRSRANSSGQSQVINTDPAKVGGSIDIAAESTARREAAQKRDDELRARQSQGKTTISDRWNQTSQRDEAARVAQQAQSDARLTREQARGAAEVAAAAARPSPSLPPAVFSDQLGDLQDEHDRILDDRTRILTGQPVTPNSPGGTGTRSGGPPGGIDKRTATCNDAVKSGHDTPAVITVDTGSRGGTAEFNYEMWTVKDRMTITSLGQTIYDSGCVSGHEKIPITLPAFGQVTVNVEPNCDGTTSTDWTFTLNCPD